MTNVVYKATADVVSKVVTLAITVAAARVLSGTDFGVLALAMTTGWILSVASDAGLPLYLAKRMAQSAAGGSVRHTPSALRTPHSALRTPHSEIPFAPVAEVMRLRALLGVIAAGAGLAVGVVVAPRPAILAFYLIVIAQILTAVLETLAHAYRGLGRSDIESSVTLAQRGVTGVAALAVLVTAPSLLGLAVALALPPGGALFVSFKIARRMTGARQEKGDSPLFSFDTQDIQQTPFSGPWSYAPVGLGILLSALYFRCDVYFVERWHGLETVGVYNAAFRIVEALRLFPAAVLAVAFPALCNAADLTSLKRVTSALVAGGVVLAAAIYLAAPFALELVYGLRFVEAAPAMRVLALALPLFFANYALTHQVIAWDGQRSYLAIASAALVTNLAGNSILIPNGGMVGAAISTLVTEIVVAGGCLLALLGQVGRVGRVGQVGGYADSLRGDAP